MPRPSDDDASWERLRDRVIGLGERSLRKSHYPQLQRRLLEAERFRVLLDHTVDAVLLLRLPGGELVDLNESARRIFGVSRDAPSERSFDQLVPPEVWKAVTEHLDDDEGGASPASRDGIHATLTRTDGSPRQVEMSVGRHAFADGDYVVILARDVTERRRIEGQLRMAQRMESVGRLAGGVAHDFNNIIAAISGYCDLLLLDLPPSYPPRADLLEIKRAIERARVLTQQLLSFSRRQPMQVCTIDVNDTVRELAPMLRRLIGEDIEFVLDLASAPQLVVADPARLEQVLMNLVVNARDAMPTGGTLRVETRTQSVAEAPASVAGAADAWCTIRVTDTGCGMDEDTQAQVFEPFFSTKPAGQGTGLGLATAFGIVSQNGGTIDVQSAPGLGSAFTVYLPRSAAKETAAGVCGPSTQAEPLVRGDETVLVVEDDDMLRPLLANMVGWLGYRALQAAGGQEALRQCEELDGRIDLVLADVVMPGMSGVTLVEHLQRRWEGIRVLFMSGYPPAELGRVRATSRRDPLLAKPFTIDALAVALRSALDTPPPNASRAARGG